jgi:hypothetical protein
MRLRVACLLDYKGNFLISRSDCITYVSWHPRVDVVTFDRKLIDFLDQNFGTISPYNAQATGNYPRKYKSFYKWSAKGLLLDYVLEIVEPITLFRSEEIKVMKELRLLFEPAIPLNGKGVRGQSRIPIEIHEAREEIFKRYKELRKTRHSSGLRG